MVQTIREFLDEIRVIRKDMYLRGERADILLVASWLDRLVISLEKVAPTIDLMAEEIETLSHAEEMECSCCTSKKTAPKKQAKKKSGNKKHAKKKKRR